MGGGNPLPASLFWADPLGGSSNDYDLFLLDATLTVVLAAVGMVLGSAALVGLLPALQTVRGRELRDELGDGKGAASGTVRPWVRQTLIASQAALVLIVLAGAALLVRSGINLQAVPIGFDTSGVLSARVALPAAQYATPVQARTAFMTILERLSSTPGVEVAALDSQPPLLGSGSSNGLIPEGRPLDMSSIINSQSHFVTPDYCWPEGVEDDRPPRRPAGHGDQRNARPRSIRRTGPDRQANHMLRGRARRSDVENRRGCRR
jgi:hypothetical protein